MPNRLARATSPYLLQHADNPVDWHEWGPEPFREAAAADKPVLLSVGYSACHWCHVMAHESFEDEATAALMNRLFVNVKVDREERPDVDEVYMSATQAMTGRGGWPMTVFLTPDGKPFFAGTYFPKTDRPGLPSFRKVLTAVDEAWQARRSDVEEQADRLTRAIDRTVAPVSSAADRTALRSAQAAILATADRVLGGFGTAPKFPQAPVLEFLLRTMDEPWDPEAQKILVLTLEAMARGGIYDQIGGGFARYSTDGGWLVPHFEKMLYDNALLARLYLRAWQQTGVDQFRVVATETLDYLLTDLALPEGGFASAEDADSEGEEGRFYVWSNDEFIAAAGPHAEAAGAVFGVTSEGNFEGTNVLHQARAPAEVAAELGVDAGAVAEKVRLARATLAAARATRIRPALDDKVVCAWNGLALRALAEAGAVLEDGRYLDAARRNARFVLSALRRPDGRLMRSWRAGRATVPGFLEDYAACAVGLYTLFQASGEPAWFREAETLTGALAELFWNGEGFTASGRDAEALVARPRDVTDNPTPSGTALAAEALLMSAHYTGDPATFTLLEDVFKSVGDLPVRFPAAVGHLLAVRHTALLPPREVAVVGSPDDDATRALARVVWERFRPGALLAQDPGDGSAAQVVPLLRDRPAGPDGPLAYVCERFACRAPVADAEALRSQLG